MLARRPHHPRHTSAIARGAAAIAAVALLFLSPAACSQIAGLDDLDFDSTGKACTSASDCDDQNACTDDTCSSEGLCVQAPTTDGPLATQTTGDCKTARCSAGKMIAENDDMDIPNDNEDCTIDGCSAGTPVNTVRPDGTTCILSGMSGICSFGKCVVKCMTTADCNDTNPCTADACDTAMMVCSFSPLPDGTPTPGATNVPGDCLQHACIGGVDMNAPYDPDIEVTPNDCDQDLCSNGTPSHPPQMAGTACQTAGGAVCDGSGSCVDCNIDTDCSGPITACAHPVCTNHTCGTSNTPNGTPTPNQTVGDCKTAVCNGSGGITSINDDNDVQVDGNPCSQDLCTNGVSSHPPEPAGTMCGVMQMCNATGQCTCVNDMQCMSPDTCGGGGMPGVCGCPKTTCAAQMVTCGSVPDACGGMLNCNGSLDGTETDVDCGGSTTCLTKCAQGKKCNVGSDCASGFCADGVCCNTACGGLCQACTMAKKGAGADGVCGNIAVGTDPNNECAAQGAASCDQNGFCNGAGACQLYASGTVCVAASCNGTTLNKTDTCNGAGTCVDAGTQSCAPYICKNAACPMSCTLDSDCDAAHYCSMSSCVAKQMTGTACAAGNQCLSANCADGVCCNSICNGVCTACDLLGSVGTCAFVPFGQSDPDTCPTFCDGMGGCQ